ncbi:MAG: hypothetical protein KGL39_44620 [Patescibacteria group bacterium]|nr:hypothetical protein [Patescibacteria group bacterium]
MTDSTDDVDCFDPSDLYDPVAREDWLTTEEVDAMLNMLTGGTSVQSHAMCSILRRVVEKRDAERNKDAGNG